LTHPAESPGAAYLLDKRAGITSRKAAAEVAGSWSFGKYGHTGTLDPDATGLLVVLMGKATRLARFLSGSEKTYRFGLELGISTDTDDTSGRILERKPVGEISRDDLEEVLAGFTGTVKQKVPAYSAVRVRGGRAYEVARRGLVPDTPTRIAHVGNWKVESQDGRFIVLSVTVSAGTYVRALARDIGERLGTLAAAFEIRRTVIGGFHVSEASGKPDDVRALMSMSEILRDYPSIVVEGEALERISFGGSIPGKVDGTMRILDGDGELLAVGEGRGDRIQPICVLV